ncbi:hypothetical protein [Corynebacterium sp. Marseille-P3884]|uniref:hypothetical protein n=1 Tax=Corynebacterium sp. Marseille-P3884 TaxID=2495409 RepID=UPI001B32ADC3|nr:hypothetical protein [Corynebacterium sp. Marseille-P3884]MBP3948177.1 hypothetical protein [Corynebacterium sp. Marseille-P3884]
MTGGNDLESLIDELKNIGADWNALEEKEKAKDPTSEILRAFDIGDGRTLLIGLSEADTEVDAETSGTAREMNDEAGDSSPDQRVLPSKSYAERSATLKLYVRDKELLHQLKRAAFEQDISLSALWEEWATEWLKKQS